MLRQKVNDRGKIRLITGKPACIGRFVLFCDFQSAESCRISHLENKNALSQVKLFKPPVGRETLSISENVSSWSFCVL